MPVNEAFTEENLEWNLLRTTSRAMSGPAPKALRSRRAGSGAGVILAPPALSPAVPLDVALRRRVAVRHFASRTIGVGDLGTVLAASELQPAQPGGVGGSVLLSLYVHAWRVQEVTPAYYLYEPETHFLARSSSAPTSADVTAMFRQVEFASAAALLVIVGDLDDGLARFGNHGYRLLLLATGAALHRCWLAAVRLGLAACVCEAPFQRANGQPLYPLPEGQIPLLALALGEASSGRDEGGRQG